MTCGPARRVSKGAVVLDVPKRPNKESSRREGFERHSSLGDRRITRRDTNSRPVRSVDKRKTYQQVDSKWASSSIAANFRDRGRACTPCPQVELYIFGQKKIHQTEGDLFESRGAGHFNILLEKEEDR